MIVYALITTVMTIIILLATAKFNSWLRVFIVGVVVLGALFFLLYLVKNFDEPVDSSRIITKEEINGWDHK